MNDKQREALAELAERYNVTYFEEQFGPAFDQPEGWVAGWVGTLWVHVSPEGVVKS